MSLLDDIQSVLYPEEDIQRRVREIGAELTEAYAGKAPLVVGVLKGAAPFMADLVRRMDLPLELDYMVVSSYGQATKTSGVVKIIKDLDFEIEGRDVIIVEDIIDTGLTLRYLADLLLRRNPRSLRIVTLLDKPHNRRVDIRPDIVGFVAPDEFVVGYGLDYAEKYRNLPFIGILKSRVYAGRA
ncbi:hypoxanthine phosphoribosyltransferase [Hydrogenibacillus schlegelii]|uniref:Hypoxanthine phosphoribosyltransferase n=1 Tax=Hydrogenibacillus schlegelii TaxID=1484 RepID=A0A132NAK1_HYDSH|nr:MULTISPECIES: hypoxanthine phosphoribosyltransferase [Hydrogenibacillus]KWX07026.1 hypoxanthine phosphoribosyltransferase [Hydrogenibacillus schlegelii]MBE3563452.1 hypoxanthine phosphoribosyltransferase [Hydrogenibacillus schlegelii]MBT9283671.1 hypoxanthine phosphoribosyltransferase [Hydrogenibacillus schlegelii]OAR04254.1 hypoxanthine phosphoribosyltransferase [Hydrogenibacillus schlegelii]PTQ53034.1 MAG: Hypoxanthine-guanine phosphoribosyltransferase [Hydrogenibacillus schlegelii]